MELEMAVNEINLLMDEKQKLQQKIEDMAKALEFYSSPSDYVAPYTGGLGKLYYDCGTVAKDALVKARD